MRAWRVHDLGEPEAVLRLDDVPAPAPGAGEVLIDVAAAALNFPDVLRCRGEYQIKSELPFTPGLEVSGTVRSVGPGVDAGLVGRRVLGFATYATGGLAEQTVAAATSTFPIPDSLDDAAAAALHVTYQTGHVALHRRARLQPGETLLVHAGAGGVGSAAIQLGVAAGARVVATAGGPEKVQVCRDLGADVAVDYRAGDFVAVVKEFTDGRGADVVYDPVGGDTFDRSTKCIAFEGRILIVGFTGGRFAVARTNHLLIKNYSVIGVYWGLYGDLRPDVIRETHEALMALQRDGRIAPLVSRQIPMTEVPAALASLGSRGTVGKIVARW